MADFRFHIARLGRFEHLECLEPAARGLPGSISGTGAAAL